MGVGIPDVSGRDFGGGTSQCVAQIGHNHIISLSVRKLRRIIRQLRFDRKPGRADAAGSDRCDEFRLVGRRVEHPWLKFEAWGATTKSSAGRKNW